MNGFFAARYGYRNVMLVALFFMNAFIFITFFSPSVQVLLVGEILCGLTWGVFATTGYVLLPFLRARRLPRTYLRRNNDLDL